MVVEQKRKEGGRYRRISRCLAALLAAVSDAEKARLLVGGLSLVFLIGHGEVLVRLEAWDGPAGDRTLGLIPNYGLTTWEVATVATRYVVNVLRVEPDTRGIGMGRPTYTLRLMGL